MTGRDHWVRRAALGAALPLIVIAAAGAAAREELYETRLSSVAMDLLTRDLVAGVGRAHGTLVGRRLSINALYEGLPSAAIGAELRQGVAVGARGPVIGRLTVAGGQQGTVTGAATLNAQQLEALRAGRLYVQINSEKAPDGNLWGWLLPRTRTAEPGGEK